MSGKIEVSRDLLERALSTTTNDGYVTVLTAFEELRALLAAPVVERQESLNDWAIDHTAGRPILVLKGCSVIEAEDAAYVIGLIRKDREQPATVSVVLPEWRKASYYAEGHYTTADLAAIWNACINKVKELNQAG